MEYSFKPLEELTLMDDYMFGAVMRDKVNLKPLLEYILKIRIIDFDFVEPPESIQNSWMMQCGLSNPAKKGGMNIWL